MLHILKSKVKKKKYIFDWQKKNKENFTIPVNSFKQELVNIGEGTYGPLEVYSWGSEGEKLSIGRYCSIAKNVKFILGGNHNYHRLSTYSFKIMMMNNTDIAETHGEIVIEDGVWIGFGALILSGIHIGKGAIIGANCVVGKNIPPYAIAVGNPAKVIQYRFGEDIRNQLVELDFYSVINEKNVHEFVQLTECEVNESLITKLRQFTEKYKHEAI